MSYIVIGVPLAKQNKNGRDTYLGGCKIAYRCDRKEDIDFLLGEECWDANPPLPFPLITEDGRSWLVTGNEIDESEAKRHYFIHSLHESGAADYFHTSPHMCIVRFSTKIEAYHKDSDGKAVVVEFPECHFRAAINNLELIRLDEYCDFSVTHRVFYSKLDSAGFADIDWDTLTIETMRKYDEDNKTTCFRKYCHNDNESKVSGHHCLSCDVGDEFLNKFVCLDRCTQLRALHKRLLDVTLCLIPLSLPPYVLLEIVGWLFYGFSHLFGHSKSIALIAACNKFQQTRNMQNRAKQIKVE